MPDLVTWRNNPVSTVSAVRAEVDVKYVCKTGYQARQDTKQEHSNDLPSCRICLLFVAIASLCELLCTRWMDINCRFLATKHWATSVMQRTLLICYRTHMHVLANVLCDLDGLLSGLNWGGKEYLKQWWQQDYKNSVVIWETLTHSVVNSVVIIVVVNSQNGLISIIRTHYYSDVYVIVQL